MAWKNIGGYRWESGKKQVILTMPINGEHKGKTGVDIRTKPNKKGIASYIAPSKYFLNDKSALDYAHKYMKLKRAGEL